MLYIFFAFENMKKLPLKVAHNSIDFFSVLACCQNGPKTEILYTANIFEVIFTVFNCVPISTVVSLYGLHLIAAPSTVE